MRHSNFSKNFNFITDEEKGKERKDRKEKDG